MSTQGDKGSSLPIAIPKEPTEQPISIEDLQRHTNVDLKKLVEICDKFPNMTYREKGKLLSTSHSNVKTLQDALEIVQHKSVRFRANRADILAGIQQRILNEHFTDTRIKKMEPRTAITAYGVIADKEYRERQINQAPATFHLSVKEVHIAIKQGQLSPDDPFNVKALKDMAGPLIEGTRALIEEKIVPPSSEQSSPDNKEIILEASKPLDNNDSE